VQKSSKARDLIESAKKRIAARVHEELQILRAHGKENERLSLIRELPEQFNMVVVAVMLQVASADGD
jgi:hypothetical protein